MQESRALNLGTELGRMLMTSGAEIHRVEESVERLLSAYGLQPEVFALPNCLTVSINTCDGRPITQMCRIPVHATDIERLERCNDLCRRLCQNPLPVEQAQELLRALDADVRRFPQWAVLTGYAAVAAFFALFYGGGLLECVSAALCGLSVGLFLLFGQRLTGSNPFFRTAVCAALAASAATALVWVGVGENLEAITIGTLMLLMPGRALTNAMREIMAGDIFSGLNRTAEVILVATAIAMGCSLPMMLGYVS